MLQHSTPSQMNTFSDCLEKAREEGYASDFQVREGGLSIEGGKRTYTPAEITVDNFYRFEGVSDPADSMILYLISTPDGLRGTLSDGYGVYADEKKASFMKEVEEISKKVNSNKP